MGQNGFNSDSVDNFMSGGSGYNNLDSGGNGSIISIDVGKLGYVGGGGGGGGKGGGKGGICSPNSGGNGEIYGSGGGGGAGFNIQSINGANGGSGANGIVIIKYKKRQVICDQNERSKIKIKRNILYMDDTLDNNQLNENIGLRIAPTNQCLPLNPTILIHGKNEILHIAQMASQLGLNKVTITASGGGGGGGYGGNPCDENHRSTGGGGGGGASGSVIIVEKLITPGMIINYTVGEGGLGGGTINNPGDAEDGYQTNFIIGDLMETIEGGKAGLNGSGCNGGIGGSGDFGGGGGGGGSIINEDESGGKGGSGGNGIIQSGCPGQDYIRDGTGNGGNGGCLVPNCNIDSTFTCGKGGVVSSFGGCGGGGGGIGGGKGGAGLYPSDSAKNGTDGTGSGGGGGPGGGPLPIIHPTSGGNGGSGYIKLKFF